MSRRFSSDLVSLSSFLRSSSAFRLARPRIGSHPPSLWVAHAFRERWIGLIDDQRALRGSIEVRKLCSQSPQTLPSPLERALPASRCLVRFEIIRFFECAPCTSVRFPVGSQVTDSLRSWEGDRRPFRHRAICRFRFCRSGSTSGSRL